MLSEIAECKLTKIESDVNLQYMHNGKVFATAGYSVFRQLVPMLIIVLLLKIHLVADRIPSPRWLKLNSDLPPIALPSSPAVANTYVSGRHTINSICKFYFN